MLRRAPALLFAMIAVFVAALGGCGGDSKGNPPVTITKLNPTPTGEPVLTGFAFPIADGCLPSGDQLMPGAPREYRQGTHEGIDFYDSDNCTSIGVGTEVLAAKAGTVARADWDYKPLTVDELADLENRASTPGTVDEQALDRYRGMQVWIDHGNGVITRYAHLSRIAEGMNVGVSVRQGDLIAYVGNSGTPESVTNPNGEMHLHFELRVGDIYLGKGLPSDQVRELYKKAFGVQ